MKKALSIILALTLIFSLASCNLIGGEKNDKEEGVKLKIAYMSGPTGMGMAKLIHDNGGKAGNEKYEFISYTDASLASADLIKGNVNMACLPTNNAAMLYNQKGGSIQVLAVNCLNSLYLMTKTGTEIKSLSDLEGKTIYTIKNGTPAVILQHILDENNINATIKTSIDEGENEKLINAPADLAHLLIAGGVEIALVPEPVATAAPLKIASQGKDYTYSVAIDLSDVSQNIAMGCVAVNKNFATQNKSAVNSFMDEYKKSIEYIANLENLSNSSQYIVDAGVLDAVPAAKKSLSNLGDAISYIDGAQMKALLNDFYNAIGVKLIGGKLPDEEFYYDK